MNEVLQKVKELEIEIGNKGTLFLDEIGEASLSTQVKLLRVLETGEYMRIGDESIRRTNTRILAASHVNLAEAVKEKNFREDLLYRLDVVKLSIPPLRERKEDIPLFLTFFLNKYESTLSFSEETIELMQQYDWPGNVRELANIVKRALTLAEDETAVITPDFLPEKIKRENGSISTETNSPSRLNAGHEQSLPLYLQTWTEQMVQYWKAETDVALEEVLQKVKELEIEIGKAFVTKMLKETLGNRKEAAERLQISLRKLRYLLNEKNQG